MRFNIILEDGGVYQRVFVLSNRGVAESKYHVLCALKYEGCISIQKPHKIAKLIRAKDVYEVEEV